jgi:hypothetical protein
VATVTNIRKGKKAGSILLNRTQPATVAIAIEKLKIMETV